MRLFVGYSLPRGIYGRYVFTVLCYFSHSTETLDIRVGRNNSVYSCGICGKWTSIQIVSQISPSHHKKHGKVELYRYDNVEPEDIIQLELRDRNLIYYQQTVITVALGGEEHTVKHIVFRAKYSQEQFRPGPPFTSHRVDVPNPYGIIIVNWDEYTETINRPLRVEEELISQTMRAQKISIKELLIESPRQPLALEGQRVIDGELRYR